MHIEFSNEILWGNDCSLPNKVVYTRKYSVLTLTILVHYCELK